MPSSFWILVFFSGWPLSGGNGATNTKFSRPTLSPGRDGRLTKEGIRDTQNICSKVVEEIENVELEGIQGHLNEVQKDGDITPLETLQEEVVEDNDNHDQEDNETNEEKQGLGVVQKMVHKFSHCGPKQTPILARRNTVARCTNVMDDIRQGKRNISHHNSEGQHVVWDYSVTGADAATDLEFSSLMERISVLNTASYNKVHVKKEVSEGSSLSRDDSSRKSLPAGALKSYMRCTKASVMKTREGNSPPSVDGDKNASNKQSPSPTGSSLPNGKVNHLQQSLLQSKVVISNKSNSKIKIRHMCPEGSASVRRKKGVTMKPSIPSVLLKGVNKLTSEASATVTSAVSHNNRDVTSQIVNNARESTVSESRKPECRTWLAPQHHLVGQCEVKCNHCLLVDLWFTIWHVEFNKK